jgi:hypothetical protein
LTCGYVSAALILDVGLLSALHLEYLVQDFYDRAFCEHLPLFSFRPALSKWPSNDQRALAVPVVFGADEADTEKLSTDHLH